MKLLRFFEYDKQNWAVEWNGHVVHFWTTANVAFKLHSVGRTASQQLFNRKTFDWWLSSHRLWQHCIVDVFYLLFVTLMLVAGMWHGVMVSRVYQRWLWVSIVNGVHCLSYCRHDSPCIVPRHIAACDRELFVYICDTDVGNMVIFIAACTVLQAAVMCCSS